jgi:hypothetical protein
MNGAEYRVMPARYKARQCSAEPSISDLGGADKETRAFMWKVLGGIIVGSVTLIGALVQSSKLF